MPTVVDEVVALLGYKYTGQADVKNFERDLAQVEQRARAVGRAIGAMTAIAGTAISAAFMGLAKSVITTGSTFEKLGIQLEALEGSAEKAQTAMKWIQDFAVATPLELQDVVKAYTQLKTFGLDPTNGSLMAMVDTMAMSGKGQEQLGRIILGVGQAWTKQKLQGQEIMQLMESGVPVWDLLSESMGKTVPELQKMSESGKLGRKEIQLLIDAMGKRATGASEKFSKSLEGVQSNIADLMTEFKRRIADAGVFNAFKKQMEAFLDIMRKWAADGTMDRVAKFFSDTLVWGLTKSENAVRRLAGHMNYIMTNWDKLSATIKGFAVIMGLLVARSMPWLAGLGVLGLILEDILTYAQGGDSLLGDVIAPLMEGVKWLDNLFRMIETFDVDKWILDKFDQITKFFTETNWLQIGREMGADLGKGIADGLMQMLPDWLKTAIGATPDAGGREGLSGQSFGKLDRLFGSPTSSARPQGRLRRARISRMSGGSTASIGHAAPWAEREAFIRAEAIKRGLNPDDMVALAKTEGAGKYSGDFMGGAYRSFGDFQLYTGGGEGNRAAAAGIDVKDPNTWRQQTQFALNRMVELGHSGPWNGPKRAGIAGGINARIAANRGNLRTLPIDGGGDVHPMVAQNRALMNRLDGARSQVGIGGGAASKTVNVGSIDVKVQQASEAPAAVGKAIDTHLQGPDTAPSRMQADPAL